MTLEEDLLDPLGYTEEDNVTLFILDTLGERHIDYRTLVPITILYGLFLVIGVLGNLATCVVIVSNEYLRTSTNVYLLNLAVTDIVTLVFAMPAELYLMWHQYPWTFGELACDLKSVISESVIYASILTIVAFTCERYLAICRPLSPLARSSTGEARRVISCIWLISFLSASPWALFTKVNYLVWENEQLVQSAWCSIPFNEEEFTSDSLYMMLASTLLYFFVPLVAVVLLYTRIGLALHRNKMQRCAATCSRDGQCQAERTYSQGIRTVIRMLVVVVFAFFFCWTPFHSQRLMFVMVTLYGSWTRALTRIQHVLFTISGVFYYFNSAMNPVLYSLMSKRFRRGFFDIRRSAQRRAGALCCYSPPAGGGSEESSGTRRQKESAERRGLQCQEPLCPLPLQELNSSSGSQQRESIRLGGGHRKQLCSEHCPSLGEASLAKQEEKGEKQDWLEKTFSEGDTAVLPKSLGCHLTHHLGRADLTLTTDSWSCYSCSRSQSTRSNSQRTQTTVDL